MHKCGRNDVLSFIRYSQTAPLTQANPINHAIKITPKSFYIWHMERYHTPPSRQCKKELTLAINELHTKGNIVITRFPEREKNLNRSSWVFIVVKKLVVMSRTRFIKQNQ
jgi:hypothetical protein